MEMGVLYMHHHDDYYFCTGGKINVYILSILMMKSFLIKTGIYITVIFVLSQLMAYVLKEPLRDAEKKNVLYDKTRWQDFYAQPVNSISLLFLGSSHAYRSFNPLI